MAKIVGLPVYTGLGMVALRPALTQALHSAAWLGTQATFACIASVMISQSPLGFLARLTATGAGPAPKR